MVNTITDCLTAFGDMVPEIITQPDNMRNAALKGHATATDLADYLGKKGLAFRDAHDVVGKLVRDAITQEVDLAELSLDALQAASDLIEAAVFAVLTLEGSINARNHPGGTSPEQVRQAIARARTKTKARK